MRLTDEQLDLANANHAAEQAYDERSDDEYSAEECHDCCLHRDACERMWELLTADYEVDPRQMGCKSCLEWEERS